MDWVILRAGNNNFNINSYSFSGRNSLKVGRNPSLVDIEVPIASISGLHCIFLKDNLSHILSIVDQSTNGVFVNGKRIHGMAQLKNGDEISLSSRHFQGNPKTSFLVLLSSSKYRISMNRFVILEEKLLGSGSYASVFLAYDLGKGMRCAAKVIDKKRFKMYPKYLKNLEREVCILKSLDHRNIVKVYDVCEEKNNDQLVIFQEFIDGGELFDHLQRKGFLPEIEVKCYIYQILQALLYLHEKNIVHRDIKPENILLETGKFSRILLVDFGLATNTAEHELMNTFCGTANYLAPEVILSAFPNNDVGKSCNKTNSESDPLSSSSSNLGYNEKVDCWAVGIVTYALISGSLPFYQEDEKETFEQIRQHSNLDFSSWEDCSLSGIDFIKGLLQKCPEKRLSVKEALNHSWFQDNKAQLFYEILCKNINPENLLLC